MLCLLHCCVRPLLMMKCICMVDLLVLVMHACELLMTRVMITKRVAVMSLRMRVHNVCDAWPAVT